MKETVLRRDCIDNKRALTYNIIIKEEAREKWRERNLRVGRGPGR